jgi:hypothetical protein
VNQLIHNVFVISPSGEPILTVKLGSIEASDAMVGGFISAIQSFANQIIGGDINHLKVGQYHLIMQRTTHDNILVIAADSDDRKTRVILDEIHTVVGDLVGNVPCEVITQLIEKVTAKEKSAGEKAKLWADYGL